jgi:hypothetical protein
VDLRPLNSLGIRRQFEADRTPVPLQGKPASILFIQDFQLLKS